MNEDNIILYEKLFDENKTSENEINENIEEKHVTLKSEQKKQQHLLPQLVCILIAYMCTSGKKNESFGCIEYK